MIKIILITVLVVAVIGLFSAVILYLTGKKFHVYEDPRIDEVEDMLPLANCGGCGFAGCRAMAEALVKHDDISNLNCPPGGTKMMRAIATLLDKDLGDSGDQVAVVKCNGTCDQRPKVNEYTGARSCAVMNMLYDGETGCKYGCLGCGDCVAVCKFDALYMDRHTGLPVVDDGACTGCGACVTACPKNIIELRGKGVKGRRVFVACSNMDRGGVAIKACKVACTGCMRCVRECKFEAVTVENFLAYVDSEKCKLCRKCAPVCPNGTILEVNFPARAVKSVVSEPELKTKVTNNDKTFS